MRYIKLYSLTKQYEKAELNKWPGIEENLECDLVYSFIIHTPAS